MEWLVILALGGVVWLQQLRFSAQSRRLAALEAQFRRRIEALSHRLTALEAQFAPASAEQETPPESAPATEEAPLEFAPAPATQPTRLEFAPQSEDDELLLDTPLPQASSHASASAPHFAPAGRAPPQRGHMFAGWLSGNRLAWLGGGAAALGGVFLFAFAAQRNWFTPPVQLLSVLALGVGLLGASEWTRRAALSRPPGRPLAACLLAGAGAAMFYAAAWAAHGRHHFIAWPGAIALLAVCALALAGLSLRHGQALGALAVGAALLAPALSSAPAWPALALTLYLGLAGAAGFALAAWRRWAWSAAVAAFGLYSWFAAALGLGELQHALAIVSFASIGGFAMAARAPAADAPEQRFGWTQVAAHGPATAIAVSAVLAGWTWLVAAPPTPILAPALIAAFHVALAALALRLRTIPPAAFAVAVGALLVGATAYLAVFPRLAHMVVGAYPILLALASMIVLATLAARPQQGGRLMISASGAIGAALLTTLAATTQFNWHGPAAWGALFAGAAALFAAAWRSAQETAEPNGAVDAWAGAASVLLLLGIESAFAAEARATAHAGAALLLMTSLALLRWRALRVAALSAAALATAHAFSPALTEAVLLGLRGLDWALLILALATAFLLAASRVAWRSGQRASMHEAPHTASVLVGLSALFLLVRWLTAGGAGAQLSDFEETALRVLALMSAGFVLSPGADAGFIGRWRGHALMAAGFLYGAIWLAWLKNPWWGPTPTLIAGPPLLNSLTLAFAAPAALLLMNALRSEGWLRRAYGVAGALMIACWIPLEIRHLFHGRAMSASGFVGLEGLAHVLWPLAFVAAGARLSMRAPHRTAASLVRFWRLAAWPALILAAFGMIFWFNPWWGAAPAFAGAWHTALVGLLLYALAAWLSAAIAMRKRAFLRKPLGRAGLIAAIAHALTAATLLVRRIFHDAAMSVAPAGDIELWAYSALWALFGAGLFALAVRRGGPQLRWGALVILSATAGNVFFLSLTRLDGVVRVGSLLGLALVLFVATWATRAQKPEDRSA